MKVLRSVLATLVLLAGLSAQAQMAETGDWRMFAAPMPETNLVELREYRTGARYWVAPVWLYNTRTGTVYRLFGWSDAEAYPVIDTCFGRDVPQPCPKAGLVPVPMVYSNENDEIELVMREQQSGDWRMFAPSTAVNHHGLQRNNYGAWLYNIYTGTVYEVFAACPPIGYESHSGCMIPVPPRDSFDRPTALDPQASGLR